MVDTPTKIADIIVPEVFNPYVIEATTLVNAFFQSGIVANVGELNFGQRGGLLLQMPYWKQIGERAQLLDDDYNLEVKKIQTAQDTAVQHARALVYGATDLAGTLAGSDPMGAIIGMMATNWSKEFNLVLLASLRGAMAVATGNTYDISAVVGDGGNISGTTFIDAVQKLGDHKDDVVGVAMHSAVEAQLAKNDLIETVRDSEGQIVMRTFMGKRVIVDDAMAALSGDIYETYIFGAGAIGYAEGNPKVPSETERNALVNGGQEYLVQRRHFVLHPRGIAWTPTVYDSPTKTTPSDTELANASNWTQKYETKNIKIIRFQHRI